MNKHVVLALMLCLATVQARLFHDDALATAGRSLKVNNACPAGCKDGACVPDSTNTGFVCTQCNDGILLNSVDGTCECPPGRFTSGNTCADCTKTNFCPGGIWGSSQAVEVSCNDRTNVADASSADNGLTTRGKRAKSVAACVNAPGHYYTLESGKPKATVCPVDTYSAGLKKQQGCVSCPSGFKTLDATKQVSITACSVPAGFYLRGPGEVAPCPMGEYQETNSTVGKCTKCATGVTTAAEQSISRAACKVLLPSYYASAIDGADGAITTTMKCPQKFYCSGGAATAEFDPTAEPLVFTNTAVAQCPNGLWTEKFGAVDANECLTPPGHFTSGSTTTICPDGSYRADWKNPAEADKCDLCGTNINSEKIDRITTYHVTTYAEGTLNVAIGPGACYIDAGQGMYYNPTTKNFTVASCLTDNYGVAAKTYGLGGFACRQCPTNMQATQALSGSYYTATGFTNPLACVTKIGYGYNGRIATQCAIDSYNDEGNRETCKKCPYGTRTTGVDSAQKTANDCGIAEGFGYHYGVVQPCPAGTYNDARQTDKITECTPCGDGLTTSQTGGRSIADCNVCKAGWGEASCGTQCGGASAATYGPVGRPSDTDSACIVCPSMSALMGFTFNYGGQSNNFNPPAAARLGAETSADCLSSYAQLAQGNWFMGAMGAALTNDTAETFADCVDACTIDATCVFATFDYAANWCQLKKYTKDTTGVTAIKAIQAGDITAASKTNKGKALASGSYTFWSADGSGWGTGTAASVAGADTVEKCLQACNTDEMCAAVYMAGVVDETAAPTGCKKIYGDATNGASQRSVTKVNLDRLVLKASVFA